MRTVFGIALAGILDVNILKQHDEWFEDLRINLLRMD